MEITYSNNIDNLKSNQLEGFFVGWPNHPNSEIHLKILKQSYACWVALEKERCIGFINALSDDIFYAYIPLLEVLPKYQGNRIGKKLVKKMLTSLDNMYAIDIICDKSIAPFYKKIGLKQCVGMVKRNYIYQDCSLNNY